MCTRAATAFRIRKAAGGLTLIDARAEPEHPLVLEVSRLGFNLDDGMVLHYAGVSHHGHDALHMMALLGSGADWFNRTIALLFKSRRLAAFVYPFLRWVRNLLLMIIGVPKIGNLSALADAAPLFAQAFGDGWPKLPPVMRDHYAVRAYSNDRVTVTGHLDVASAWWLRLPAKLTGILVPYNGKQVPVEVTFTAGRSSPSIIFDRVFHFPGRSPVSFRSEVEVQPNGDCIEFMRFGLGWRLRYRYNGTVVLLEHRGYVWRALGLLVPMPFSFILGSGHAEETPLSDNEFSMWTHTLHPWFGKTFAYSGSFRITAVTQSD
jgi:hypothetical protein